MGDFADALIAIVSGTALWGQLANAVPAIGVAVLFAIGYFVIRRVIKGLGKGKVNV